MTTDKRLPITITDEDQRRIHRLIPWGLTSRIMRLLLLQVLDLLEEHGDIVLGALLSGKVTALDLLKVGVKEYDTIVEPMREKTDEEED